MSTKTTNYGFIKPDVDSEAERDTWGQMLNENFDSIDARIYAFKQVIDGLGALSKLNTLSAAPVGDAAALRSNLGLGALSALDTLSAANVGTASTLRSKLGLGPVATDSYGYRSGTAMAGNALAHDGNGMASQDNLLTTTSISGFYRAGGFSTSSLYTVDGIVIAGRYSYGSGSSDNRAAGIYIRANGNTTISQAWLMHQSDAGRWYSTELIHAGNYDTQVVEANATSTGGYIRFASGLLECYGRYSSGSTTSFPAKFVDTASTYVQCSLEERPSDTESNVRVPWLKKLTTTTLLVQSLFVNSQATSGVNGYYHAIGRWK